MTETTIASLANPIAFLLLAGIFYLWVYYRINKYNCYGK